MSVLVFLHGMYRDAAPEAEYALEARLADVAAASGVTVYIHRGRAGLCDWDRAYRDWRCWPTRRGQLPVVGEILVELGEALVEVARQTGADTARPVVFGYSNGGFLAAAMASETSMVACGYVIAHAGGTPPMSFGLRPSAPALLIWGAHDPNREQMQALLHRMREGGWAPRHVETGGGHDLTGEDLALALRFALECSAN
ncbi:MAG: hypothetical protein H6730_30265 [Deltaproteobacteria bacterium]|nr:hypothetical protein [Deltaproteobacteria bacterium]